MIVVGGGWPVCLRFEAWRDSLRHHSPSILLILDQPLQPIAARDSTTILKESTLITKLLTTARLVALPAVASTPMCALLLPIAASILLHHAVNQMLDND